MITPENFAAIADAVAAGGGIDNEGAKELIQTLYELDANLVILQNGLELSVENMREIIPGVVEKTLSMSGRTDSKSKKKAAKYAAEVTARFEIALQMYLAGAAEKAEEMLKGIDGLTDEEDEATDEAPKEATNE